jgi:acyl-CoA reductase-like NAD-dependent aldehyde dehydrogenase
MSNFVWQVGQNLLAGNTVVFKHSEETPLFGKALEDLVVPLLPEGVFSEVYGAGDVGDMLVHQDIDMICFTGSTKTGQYLYTVAAEKMIPVLMELGGSAAGIVCEDADIDSILPMIYTNRFGNCGQICDGLKRLIVHTTRVEEVEQKLRSLLSTKKIGDAADPDTDIGPLVAKRQLDLLESQVADAVAKGAQIITGGKRPTGLSGAYYEPTLLTNITPDMRVWNEEVFGPVLPIITFETEEQAIRMANHTQYGLGGYVFTAGRQTFDRISRQLQTGMVSQNNLSYVHATHPFGGYKKSGLGREHGKYGFAEVTQLKVVAREK